MPNEVFERARAALEKSRVPDVLPEDLVKQLARLHDQPPQVAEGIISSMGIGSRAALASAGLVDGAAVGPDQVAMLRITDAGWQTIKLAAIEYASEFDETQDEHDLDREQQRWEHDADVAPEDD